MPGSQVMTPRGGSVLAVPAATSGAREHGGRRWWQMHPGGVVVGAAFSVMAMTPSLLPREWLFQAVVSGISAAIGYGLGVGGAWLLRRRSWWRAATGRLRRRAPAWSRRTGWAVLLASAAAVQVVVLVLSAGWQRELAAVVGTDPPTTAGWLRAGPVLVVVAVLLLATARAVRLLARLSAAALARFGRLPRRVAAVGGAVVAVLVLAVLVNEVVLRSALSAADEAFSEVNEGTRTGVRQPEQPTRSGSPASLVAWETLGAQGRTFVAGGRPAQDLAEAGGREALEPIRVYIGLDSAPGPQEQAELAVAELERTGAFERAVLVVAGTTGTGWVNAAAADGVELLHAGDTAVVATQYSYLPSWLSFLLDRSRAEEAGRLLVDAVHARVDAMPEGDRPRLLVYGESLGSRGSEGAFTSLADVRAVTDGVLWVGPPNSNDLWSALVARRDPGTTEVEPVYADGLVVRFGAEPSDLTRLPTPWLEPRVVYLQHASDPITWWSPGLLLTRPDWLAEPRAQDAPPNMRWYPVVTFWQVTVDMVGAESVPAGHGHNYEDAVPTAWAAISAPEGWTAADTDRLEAVLAR